MYWINSKRAVDMTLTINLLTAANLSFIIVHFKRLGSRHIHKEIEISYCVFGFNEIIYETGLKPNSDTYTQLEHHQ